MSYELYPLIYYPEGFKKFTLTDIAIFLNHKTEKYIYDFYQNKNCSLCKKNQARYPKAFPNTCSDCFQKKCTVCNKDTATCPYNCPKKCGKCYLK